MKVRKTKPDKIYRVHEIPNDYNDCDRIDSDEDDEDWRNGTTKEVKKLLEYEFGCFYPN